MRTGMPDLNVILWRQAILHDEMVREDDGDTTGEDGRPQSA